MDSVDMDIERGQEVVLSASGTYECETMQLSSASHGEYAIPDISVDLDGSIRLPLEELSSLGSGLSSLAEQSRTISQTLSVSGKNLVEVVDSTGNPLDLSVLFNARDGSGKLASFRDAEGKLAQARLREPTSQTVEAVTQIPVDATALFMAAALMEINAKLDAIQKTQREMFTYLKNKDKAKSRGNLKTLVDVLDDYRYNWNNDQYKTNKHILVQAIRKDAEESIVFRRAEIRQKLRREGLTVER